VLIAVHRNGNSAVSRHRHLSLIIPHTSTVIVRILFMVPIYAWVSFGSYVFWNHATPLLLLRDCYESTVLTAFFYLLLVYISPELAGQRDVMRRVGMSVERDAELRRKGLPPDKWAFPLFWIKSKPAVSTKSPKGT
jgi:hypothetical protein